MNLIKRNKTVTYQFVVFETERSERANGQSERISCIKVFQENKRLKTPCQTEFAKQPLDVESVMLVLMNCVFKITVLYILNFLGIFGK